MMKNQNPFKKIKGDQTPSPKLKNKVLESIKLSQLLINITELFTLSLGSSAKELIDKKDLNKFKK